MKWEKVSSAIWFFGGKIQKKKKSDIISNSRSRSWLSERYAFMFSCSRPIKKSAYERLHLVLVWARVLCCPGYRPHIQLHGPKFSSDGLAFKKMKKALKLFKPLMSRSRVLCVSWRAATALHNSHPGSPVMQSPAPAGFFFFLLREQNPLHTMEICAYKSFRFQIVFPVNHHLKAKSSARLIYVSGVTSSTFIKEHMWVQSGSERPNSYE